MRCNWDLWGFSFTWRTVIWAAVCLCQKLGACPGAKQLLLGMEQCALGPDYWCKNMLTATKCDVSISDCSVASEPFLLFSFNHVWLCKCALRVLSRSCSSFRLWLTADATCGYKEEEQKLTYREKTRKYCSAASFFIFFCLVLHIFLKLTHMTAKCLN